jgi:hypothetical protein
MPGDLDGPRGRFNRRLAVGVAFAAGEGDDDHPAAEAEAVLRKNVGDWLLEDLPGLGKGRAISGSAGRGAEGWMPVVEWTAKAIADNIIDLAIASAFMTIIARLRRPGRGKAGPPTIYFSRGAAAAAAADHVSRTYGDAGPLEVEAVQEPTAIGGRAPPEISYHGIEPWVVLLRNQEKAVRYIVVVAPDGNVMGALQVEMLEWERLYLPPGGFMD